MATQTIHGYSAATGIDPVGDYFLIDPASTGNYNKINRNIALGITGAPLGTTDSQAVSNKTIGNTNGITVKDGSFTLQNSSDTTKIGVFSLAGNTTGTTRTYTLPNASVTLASLTGTETLSGKTITSPTITGGTIDNSTITVDSISGHTTSTIVTVGGVQMNNGVVATTGAVNTNSIAAGAVVPNSLVGSSGTGWTWQSWTPTWTNLTIGNGTLVAKYCQIGKVVFFQLSLIFGNTTAIGSNAVQFSLPAETSTSYLVQSPIAQFTYFSGSSVYVGLAKWQSSSLLYLTVNNGSATYDTVSDIGTTIPFTWGTTNQLFGSGFYQLP
jgi:hypothetical protein